MRMSNKCGIQENSLQSHSIQLHHETKCIVSKDLGLLREQTEIPKHWCSFGELQQKIQIAWGETVCIYCTYNIPYTTLYLCIICYQTPEEKKPICTLQPPYLQTLTLRAIPSMNLRCISLWWLLKLVLRLDASPSSSLLPMIGIHFKNLWNLNPLSH